MTPPPVRQGKTDSKRDAELHPAGRRVCVVYPHLPHYRFGVFREMELDVRYTVEFIADATARDLTIETIPFSELRSVRRVQNQWFGRLLWQKGLLRLLVKGRYDVAIFLGDVSYVSTWVAAALLRIMGRRVLFWTIGWHHPNLTIGNIGRIAYYRLPHALLLYGSIARDIGLKFGFKAKHLRVIGNSWKSAVHKPDPDSVMRNLRDLTTGRVPETAHLIAVARLTSGKRFDLLIDAAARLNQCGRSVALLLVGDGPARDELERRAIQQRVPANFLGPVYSESALDAVYALSDLCVIPGWAGLSVIQSLQHGVPVITHNDLYAHGPEVEAIRSGETGYFFRAGDADDLARTIDACLRQDFKNFRGQACRQEAADHWSAHSQADRIAQAIAREPA